MGGMPQTPLEVSGVSLKDLHAQQKASDDLNRLLKSEDHGAKMRAFQEGLAAGAATPLLLGAVGWLQKMPNTVQGIEQQAYVAHALKSQGMPAEKAHRVAAGVVHYLGSGPGVSEEATQAAHAMLGRAGGQHSADEAKKVLVAARNAYNAAGGAAPDFAGGLLRSAVSHGKKLVLPAAVFGALGGVAAMRHSDEDKKKLRSIRQKLNVLQKTSAARVGWLPSVVRDLKAATQG